METSLTRMACALLAGLAIAGLTPAPAAAEAFFSDGYLGLTREELRAKLGPPHKIRERGAALRVYKYYAPDEWETVINDQVPNAMGEDVYIHVRDKVHVRYSFQFVAEQKPNSDVPVHLVRQVEIEFVTPDPLTGSVESLGALSVAVPLAKLPTLVPEFRPSTADDAPTYRSNLFIIFLQQETSKEARRLVKDRQKDDYDWSLSYRVYTSEALPAWLTLNSAFNRMEITVDSLPLIKDRNRLTHEAIVNPYSAKASALAPPPEPPQKKIPKPRYAP